MLGIKITKGNGGGFLNLEGTIKDRKLQQKTIWGPSRPLYGPKRFTEHINSKLVKSVYSKQSSGRSSLVGKGNIFRLPHLCNDTSQLEVSSFRL